MQDWGDLQGVLEKKPKKKYKRGPKKLLTCYSYLGPWKYSSKILNVLPTLVFFEPTLITRRKYGNGVYKSLKAII